MGEGHLWWGSWRWSTKETKGLREPGHSDKGGWSPTPLLYDARAVSRFSEFSSGKSTKEAHVKPQLKPWDPNGLKSSILLISFSYLHIRMYYFEISDVHHCSPTFPLLRIGSRRDLQFQPIHAPRILTSCESFLFFLLVLKAGNGWDWENGIMTNNYYLWITSSFPI